MLHCLSLQFRWNSPAANTISRYLDGIRWAYVMRWHANGSPFELDFKGKHHLNSSRTFISGCRRQVTLLLALRSRQR